MQKVLMYHYRYSTISKRRKKLFLLFIALVFILTIYITATRDFKNIFCEILKCSQLNQSYLEENQQQICKLPNLDVNYPPILEIMAKEKLEPLDCTNSIPLLFDSWSDEKPYPPRLIPIGNMRGVRFCCYRTILFRKGLEGEEFSQECWTVHLLEETVIPSGHEFIAIECTFFEDEEDDDWRGSRKSRLVDMHAFVHLGQKETSTIWDYRKPNVVILGVDSMSRMNFHRTMLETRDYFENELAGVELEGMNKIGDNTLPNVGTMLINQFISDDHPLHMTHELCNKSSCDFIWNRYAKNGYKTLFAEDDETTGMYRVLGLGEPSNGSFHPEPDYFFPSILQVLEKYLGHERRITVNWCFGPRSALHISLEYLKKMAFAMKQTRNSYFQFSWFNTLTHDYLTGGRLADKEIKSFLKWNHEKGYLDNTILILMSDHGSRIGEIRSIDQGQNEDRLPFFYMVLPKWWRELYSKGFKNLINNRKRLTTVWDVHQSLEHILKPEYLENDRLERFQQDQYPASKGISLFLPVPFSRTCETAGVPLIYCTCNSIHEAVPVNHSIIVNAVSEFLEERNSILEFVPQCAQLSLGTIFKANWYSFENYRDISSIQSTLSSCTMYHVVYDTVPKWTTFDALIVQVGRNGSTKWTVRNVGRSTWYWLDSRSSCLEETNIEYKSQIMPFCYCQ